MKRFSLQKFLSNQSGNVLILTGLGILFLVGIGGAGYDLGRQQLVRQKIQQASDAAALAAAGMDFGTSDATRQNTAQAFFALNYPNDYLGIARPTPSISIAGETITVRGNTRVPTSFVGNFGVGSIAAAGSSTTQFKRNQNVLDVILVMDNSFSMNAQDVAASTFLNGDIPAMIASCIAEFNSPAQMTYYGFSYAPYCKYPYQSFEWGALDWGFVGPNRINALRKAADNFAKLLTDPNPRNNRIALVKWDNVLVGSHNFSNNYTAITTALRTMFAGGATNSTVGLQRARTLANGFRSGTVHAVVLMTDGANEGKGTNGFAEQVPFNNASLAICNAFKAQGTIVYTIGFGSQLTETTTQAVRANQFLSDCATGPNGTGAPNLNQFYYRAADAAALEAAFNAIAGSLKRVQILQ